MNGLAEFLKDINSIEKYSSLLTSGALFIAGICSGKTGLNSETILKYLAYAQRIHEKGILNNTNKTIIELHFYNGDINMAKKLLRQYKSKGSTELLDSQTEINSKSEPLNHSENPKLVQVEIEAKPAQKIEQVLSTEEIHKLENEIFNSLNVLRRIDEREALQQRKLDEVKRLKAEVEANDLKLRLEREYKEKLEKELEERKRREEQALKCVICKEIVKETEVFMLETCLHSYHKKCAKEYVTKSLDDNKIPIVCHSCKAELTIIEIKAQLTGRQYKKYEEMTFRMFLEMNDADYNSCPTSTCGYLFELEDDTRVIDCPLCKRSYCLNCRNNAHKGMACPKNFLVGPQGVIKGQKFKACPMCLFWVEKQKGINNLRCRCGTNFCFKCGKHGAVCGCD